MNIPEELQVEIIKLAEYIKKSVDIKEEIDSLIENMDMPDNDKVAMYNGIIEYVNYGQFCIEDDIKIEEMKVENLIDLGKSNPFKRIYI